MGHKQSLRSSRAIDDLAFGTAPNAVKMEEVIEVTQKIPGKLFGAKMIENDPSMRQMQYDLLSFDDTLRRLFRRKKKKLSQIQDTTNESYQDRQYYAENQEYYDQDGQYYAENQEYFDQDGQYYAENQEYFDQNQEPIPEEDEDYLSSSYVGENKQTPNKDNQKGLPWRCKYCTAENKSTDIDCRQCKQSGTNF
ncbi:unnamed protein product [Rotaria sp. Silwood1]|nr:unnamed protein product [Rotaria sp. Silwood1]CAF0982977.1 unnamed protein product [Rotaria sp. Silwood1]CAF0991669.1 unnamed protein product [Rotaria sp. Silwood1]CAF3394074.1 unnamed protein product [Rotaria sp. Silwood1]CAF3405219.1 unnamed protein product [Rotaria sp. Silwood1]